MNIRVFPKFYKVGNIGNKGLHGEEQKNVGKKLFLVGLEPMPS